MRQQSDTKPRERGDDRFGRYRLRGILGQGGMGRLYLAEQMGIEGFTKVVALKRILPHLADSEHFRSLFLEEARVSARLEHPNIVTTYELGEVDGQYFISMEYLPGEDLAAIARRCGEGTPMPLEIAAVLAQQSANGLHYAHEARDAGGRPAGLVHRDVNPSNILVTYFGMVKLLDFGIVKLANRGQTMPGHFKGKYAYSAPEQITDGKIDRCTDVFSLGICLWECLTGRRLFERPTDGATVEAVRSATLKPPSALRPDVPQELDAITMRALARERALRYQTAHAMSEALDRFLQTRNRHAGAKDVGQWLTALFGPERASLKKSIAQGIDIDNALARLSAITATSASRAGEPSAGGKPRAVAKPRAIWSTQVGRGSFSSAGVASAGIRPRTVVETSKGGLASAAGYEAALTPVLGVTSVRATAAGEAASTSKRRARTPLLLGGLGLLLVVGGAGAWLSRDGAGPQRALERAPLTATGGFNLVTDPPGAHVFVDGEPTGLVTPAVLGGLRAGRTVEIRLDKDGFAPVKQQLRVASGAPKAQTFTLEAANGTVKVEGLRRSATLFVDDVAVDATSPLSLPLGARKLRVEHESDVLAEGTVEIRPGEQVVDVRALRAGGTGP